MLFCTPVGAFEIDGGGLGVSADTTILHTFLSTPACTACTDMKYLKELECDVITAVMANEILASFLHRP